jgi:hypothetical protein
LSVLCRNLQHKSAACKESRSESIVPFQGHQRLHEVSALTCASAFCQGLSRRPPGVFGKGRHPVRGRRPTPCSKKGRVEAFVGGKPILTYWQDFEPLKS